MPRIAVNPRKAFSQALEAERELAATTIAEASKEGLVDDVINDRDELHAKTRRRLANGNTLAEQLSHPATWRNTGADVCQRQSARRAKSRRLVEGRGLLSYGGLHVRAELFRAASHSRRPFEERPATLHRGERRVGFADR